MSTKPRIIKKYPNRRLYDTQTCSYITLHAVKEIVLNHIPFKVIDVKTDQDVTQAILLQIIHDHENTSASIFTTELLQNLIRFYGHPLQKDLSQWLEHSFQFLAQSAPNLDSDEAQASLGEWMKHQTDMLGTFSQMAKQNVHAWRSFFESHKAHARASDYKPPEDMPGEEDL